MHGTYELIVRFAETDAMGIVHHSNYPIWFEAARTEYIKTLGLTYSEFMQRGINTPLMEVHNFYKRPAIYEDRVRIETRLVTLSPFRIAFAYRLYRNDETEPMGYGRTVHALVDDTLKLTNFKKKDPELYAKFEAVLQEDEMVAMMMRRSVE
jgi:acyl-CoA thioester hydrolase